MAINLDKNNKTINGYHDKSVNKYGLINRNYPILTDEIYSPFLITRDHYYLINTGQVSKLLTNYKALQDFNTIKVRFANILIIPGLIISITYILHLFGMFKQVAFIENSLSTGITSSFFWLSVFGVIILWHDYYKSKSTHIKLPKAETISPKVLETITNTDFNFGRYSQLEAIHFLSEQSQDLIYRHIKGDIFQTFEMYNELVTSNVIIKRLIKRANISLSSEHFTSHNINNNTIPSYQTSSLRSIIIYALEEALLTDSPNIEPVHFFLAITRVFPIIQKLLQSEKTSIGLLREVAKYNIEKENKAESTSLLDPYNIYNKTGGIANSWVYGYTYILNHFSKDITETIINTKDKFGIGHENEVDALVSILGRVSKKHALLIGEPGVGKSSLLKGLAQRINWGNVPPQLENKRIIQLDINGLIAYKDPKQNIESLVEKAMHELEKAGNTILYIDEMQELIPAKAESAGHSLAQMLLPYILESKFPIVGTVNYADYKKYFYTNESLRQSFTNIEVSELSAQKSLEILESKIPILEENFKLFITLPALKTAIELAQRYIRERMLPDSAINVIESACSWAQANNVSVLTSEHVSKSVSIQTNIPVESISSEDADKLLSLSDKIKEKVIGQEDAIKTAVEALKRARTDLKDPNRPIGVFLFIGPTGVGKTHLAKVISSEYFDTGEDIIRVDMSEYQEAGSISKVLGTTQTDKTSQTNISLLDRVKTNPYSVLLFDEIEKADASVLDLFLQLFDEGRLTSNSGETVDFTNTIIICTSNIGSRVLLESLDKKKSALWDEIKARVVIELKQAIRPELFNRFDDIVVFSPLNIEMLTKITELLLIKLSKRISEQGITLEWEKAIPTLISNKAYDPALGARPLRRYIQEKVEGKLATQLLEKKLNSGDTIKIKSSWIK